MKKILLTSLIITIAIIGGAAALINYSANQKVDQNQQEISQLSAELDSLTNNYENIEFGERETTRSTGVFDCLSPCVTTNSLERSATNLTDNETLTIGEVLTQLNESLGANGYSQLTPALDEFKPNSNNIEYFYADKEGYSIAVVVSGPRLDIEDAIQDKPERPTNQEFLNQVIKSLSIKAD